MTADPTNGLEHDWAVQCQHISVATGRIAPARCLVGTLTVDQIRETVAVLLDL